MKEYLNSCGTFNQITLSNNIEELKFHCSTSRNFILPTQNYTFYSKGIDMPRIGPAGVEEESGVLDLLGLEVIKEVYIESMTRKQADNIKNGFSELVSTEFDRVKHVRLITNAFGYLDLFLSFQDQELKVIIVCDNYCHNTVPQIVQVRRK